ncbi:hypothetical protein V8E36_003390 [Tilletia maclaganii]
MGRDWAAKVGQASAQRLEHANSKAKRTGRRGDTSMPDPPISIKGNEIWLLPFNAWELHVDRIATPSSLGVFLQQQGCIIPARGITKSMNSAEVMEYIYDEFAKKKQKWKLSAHGFSYAKLVGPVSDRVVTVAGLSPSEYDAKRLELEYPSGGKEASRCVIVTENLAASEDFRNFFGNAKEVPPQDRQERAELVECDFCLLVLPKKHAEAHAEDCDRLGKDPVPRKTGIKDKIAGSMSIDWTSPFWKGDLAGIHQPNDFDGPKEIQDRFLTPSVPGWNDPHRWCWCQGLGRVRFGKRGAWIECSSGKQCAIRHFHKGCVEIVLDGLSPAQDWTCPFCILLKGQEDGNARAERAKRRRT